MNPPLSHPHVLPTGKKRPAIALIIPNTLTTLGLAGLLTRMVPHAEIALFHDFREAEAETERGKAFFHYFTTAPVLLNHAAFFLRHQQKTIVLVHGDDVRHLPQGFHTLNVLQSEKELVRAFLERTCELLQQNTSFFRRINLRILQCDDKLRSDRVIHDAKEFADYMTHFELIGQSATDFRPVFEHVDQLVAEGAFHSLRGLIYFTDGLGLYPKKRPKYDAAFVMLEGEAWPDSVPPWGIRVILREDEIITE